MLDFLFQSKREEVRRLLSRQLNRVQKRQLETGGRHEPRGAFCQSVWVAPFTDGRAPDFGAAYPAVSKDAGPEGLAVIVPLAHAPGETLLVGLETDDDEHLTFLRCEVRHCTALGLGFYQVGLHAEQVVHPCLSDVRGLLRRAAQVNAEGAATGTVTAAHAV
ncbi:MAG: hypothetical protein ACT4QC_17315 [Planctomycetaceae bacterium]